MRRLSEERMKELEFRQFNYTNAKTGFVGGFKVIVSYGLVVALIGRNFSFSAKGYHDYSPTTAKQVTQITGINTAERRKTWKILEINHFEKLVEELQL